MPVSKASKLVVELACPNLLGRQAKGARKLRDGLDGRMAAWGGMAGGGSCGRCSGIAPISRLSDALAYYHAKDTGC